MAEKYDYEYSEMKIRILVDGTEYTRLIPDFTLTSRRDSPLRLLEFQIGNVKSPAQGGLYSGKVAAKSTVKLYWGIGDDQPMVFEGTVVDANDTKCVHAWAVDMGKNLKDTISAVNTVDEKTSQIIKRLAAEALLKPPYMVNEDFDVTFPHWCCAGDTIQESLTRLSTCLTESFGKDMKDVRWWVDRENHFHWGPFRDESNGRNTLEKPLELTHKTNIIDLMVPKGHGEIGCVTTHAWPYFDHSQKVKIIDERLAKCNAEYRTEEVRHVQRGFSARTLVFFREIV